MDKAKLVTFDDECRLRILDAEKYKASDELSQNCETFTSKVAELEATVRKYVKAVETAAKGIEAEKLRAIGLRNKCAARREQRESEFRMLQEQRADKQTQLDDLAHEERSLEAVLEAQKVQAAKLKGIKLA